LAHAVPLGSHVAIHRVVAGQSGPSYTELETVKLPGDGVQLFGHVGLHPTRKRRHSFASDGFDIDRRMMMMLVVLM
jgi:hypothetical protein